MPITGELQKIEFEVFAGIQPLAFGDAVYRGIDGKVYPAHADTLETSTVLGIVSSPEGIPPLGGGLVMTQGVLENVLVDFFAGDVVYLSTAGVSLQTLANHFPVVPADIRDRHAFAVECGRAADNAVDLIIDIRHAPPYFGIALGDTYIAADGSVTFINNQDMGDHRITTVADPVDPQDAVNKRFLTTFLQQSIQSKYARLAVDTTTTAKPNSTPTFVDLLTIPITTFGGPLLIWFAVGSSNSQGNDIHQFRVILDGTPVYPGAASNCTAAHQVYNATDIYRVTPAAGAHTLKLQWNTSKGEARIRPVTFPGTEYAALLIAEVAA